MENKTIDQIQDYAFLLKGLSVVNDIYNATKDGENVTKEENDAAQYFLNGILLKLTSELKDVTDNLR